MDISVFAFILLKWSFEALGINYYALYEEATLGEIMLLKIEINS